MGAAKEEHRELMQSSPILEAGEGADRFQPGWRERGPLWVTKGQAANEPDVSGRVNGIAISSDGQRVYAASSNGGLWRSTDAGKSWLPMMRGFDEDPEEVRKTAELGRRGRGLFHGADTLACGDVALVEGSDEHSDRLYVGTGEGYGGLDSYFGIGPLVWAGGWRPPETAYFPPGRDFTPPSDPLLGYGFYQLAVDPNDPETVYGATNRGLYRRRGASEWWHKELPRWYPLEIPSVVIARKEGEEARTVVYASQANGKVHQSNGNGEWGEMKRLFKLEDRTKPLRVSLAVQPDDPDTLYALAERGSYPVGAENPKWGAGRVYRWAGDDWKAVDLEVPKEHLNDWNRQGFWNLSIAVDPKNKQRIYVGMASVQVPLASDEWGTTTVPAAALYQCEPKKSSEPDGPWQAKHIGKNVHADVHALVFDQQGNLWVGCDGGVFRRAAEAASDDDFEPRNHGLAVLTLEHLGQHPTDPGTLYCGSQDNGCLRHARATTETAAETDTDTAKTDAEAAWVWEHFEEADSGQALVKWDTPAADPDEVLISGNRTTLLNKKVGGYASMPNEGPDPDDKVQFYPPLAGAPYNPNGANAAEEAKLAAFGSDKIYISNDFGKNWKVVAGSRLNRSHRASDISFDGQGTISRGAGSWLEDGFKPDFKVRVKGSKSNNGFFTVKDVTEKKLTVKESGKSELAGASIEIESWGPTYKSLAFANAGTLFAGTTEGNVYRFDHQSDGGWTRRWLSEGFVPPVPVTCIAVDPADKSGGSIYITVGGVWDFGEDDAFHRVYHYDGNRWESKSGTREGLRLLPVQHNAIAVHPVEHHRLYAAADIGIWYSPDGGEHWGPWSRGLPDAAVLDLKIWPPPGPVGAEETASSSTGSENAGSATHVVPHRLRAATHGRGLFERYIDPPDPELQIDVGFVLDTTGSMRDLIETAKKTIWGIGQALAKPADGHPRPTVRVGLIGYRDRDMEGHEKEAYVTRQYAFTTDLDSLHRHLQDDPDFTAAGGGDTPEAVDTALDEAVNDLSWSSASRVKVIFLVGDAPPHEGRKPKVYKTAEAAKRKGIVINTLLCGDDDETKKVWQEIAKKADGHFRTLPQSGDGFDNQVLETIRQQTGLLV